MSRRSPRRGLAHRLRNLWEFKVTAPGKVLLACVVITGLVGWITFRVPVYRLFVGLLALSVVSSLAELLFRPKLELRDDWPERAVASQPVAIAARLTNRGRSAGYDVSAGCFVLPPGLEPHTPAELVPRLAPGETREVQFALRPRRRGVYDLDAPRPFTTFPFHLVRTGSGRRDSRILRVLPDFHPVNGVDVPVAMRFQPGGVALTSRVGESPEYIGNREYRPGDSFRRLDYRSWARLTKPVVREYQEEFYSRVALVLDTHVPYWHFPGANGFAALEAGVSLAASLADAMSRGEYIIDVFAAGPQLHVFRTGRHRAHFQNVLDLLSAVRHTRGVALEKVAPALVAELDNISTVLFVMLNWTPARRDLVRQAAEAGCAVKVYVVHRRAHRLGESAGEVPGERMVAVTPAEVFSGGLESL